MKQAQSAVKFYLAAFIAALFLSLGGIAQAQPTFPKLTGRVVDEANIISPEIENQINAISFGAEQSATDQLVVVTLNSLQDYEIEEYGYQLGRAWGIGQAKANNGVILIIAPNERKVRIEVGYGLEGIITDAVSREIIQERIIPSFKAGDMQAGILAGVMGIDEILKLSPEEQQARAKKADLPKSKNTSSEDIKAAIFVILLIIFFIVSQNSRSNRFRRRRGGIDILPIILHDWNDDDDHRGGGGFGGFGGGGGFGGFGGGGGGFGGGGSSGSW